MEQGEHRTDIKKETDNKRTNEGNTNRWGEYEIKHNKKQNKHNREKSYKQEEQHM